METIDTLPRYRHMNLIKICDHALIKTSEVKIMQIESHCQIVAGMSYDTSKAELIGWVYDTSLFDTDYEGIKRHLMRHQDGHYFLFSLFGTLTRRPFGQVVPLSEQDAQQWSAKNGVNFLNGGSNAIRSVEEYAAPPLHFE